MTTVPGEDYPDLHRTTDLASPARGSGDRAAVLAFSQAFRREADSLVRTLTGHTGSVTSCAFSPDSYGPIVLTPVDRGQGPALTCPACRQEIALPSVATAEVVRCPRTGCGLELRANPFVLAGCRQRRHLGFRRNQGG